MANSSYLSGTGKWIGQGGMLVSENNNFQLILQTDGNLVVYYWPNGYQPNGTWGPCNVVWSPETFGSPARTLYFNNGWLAVAYGTAADNEVVWAVNGNPAGSSQTYCVSMDNDGCVRIYPSATPPAFSFQNPPTTATWQSPNCILANILYGPAVGAFPPFSTTGQKILYNNQGSPTASGAPTNLVGEFIANWGGPTPTTVTDLRTNVYQYPVAYPPASVQNALSGIQTPTSFPPGCTLSDWNAVVQQINQEVAYLNQLYSFQGFFNDQVGFTNNALNLGFGNATDYLDKQNFSSATGTGELFAILAGIIGIAGAAIGPLTCAVIGAIAGIVAALPAGGSDELSGDLDAMQVALGNIETNASNTAELVYPAGPTTLITNPIPGDWGKLQLFASLVSLGVLPGEEPNYTTIQNQFEISVYQMVLPPLVPIIPATNPGPPTPGETMLFCETPPLGKAVPNPPSAYSLESGPLWQRLTSGLAVPAATILARQGQWALLPLVTWTKELGQVARPTHPTYTYSG